MNNTPPTFTFWQWLSRLVSGKPHLVVRYSDGRPYLRRWYLLPRNRRFNAYLHHIMLSDESTDLHDHPWDSVSILFAGEMKEVYAARFPKWRKVRDIPKWKPQFRTANTGHRLILDEGKSAWTLFLTGSKKRDWGFWTVAEGRFGSHFLKWVHHTQYSRSGE